MSLKLPNFWRLQLGILLKFLTEPVRDRIFAQTEGPRRAEVLGAVKEVMDSRDWRIWVWYFRERFIEVQWVLTVVDSEGVRARQLGG